MAEKVIFVTGRPGVGKTTLVKRVVDYLRERGRYVIKGFYTLEVREGESRIGFRIVSLDGDEDWLAHVSMFRGGPRVGKYWVNVDAIERIGIRSVEEGIRSADLIVIDEIGPMELKHPRFLPVVRDAVSSGKPVLATIHISYDRSNELRELVRRGVLITIDLRNRDAMFNVVRDRVERAVAKH